MIDHAIKSLFKPQVVTECALQCQSLRQSTFRIVFVYQSYKYKGIRVGNNTYEWLYRTCVRLAVVVVVMNSTATPLRPKGITRHPHVPSSRPLTLPTPTATYLQSARRNINYSKN